MAIQEIRPERNTKARGRGIRDAVLWRQRDEEEKLRHPVKPEEEIITGLRSLGPADKGLVVPYSFVAGS